MGIYSNVVSTVKPIDKIRTFIGGVAKDITSGWVFVNGVRKQIFPTTEVWELVFEQLTPGTYTFNVGWGKYKIEMSAGGGGAGTAIGNTPLISPDPTAASGASGGSGAYGVVPVNYASGVTDTITIVVGAAGTGATKTNGTAASTAGGNTTLSDTTHGSSFVVLGGGGAGYADARGSHDSSSAGVAGTVTTSIIGHDLHNGSAGVAYENGTHTVGNTINPSPYASYGYGGGFSYRLSSGSQSASNGAGGYVRIYKSNIYPA